MTESAATRLNKACQQWNHLSVQMVSTNISCSHHLQIKNPASMFYHELPEQRQIPDSTIYKAQVPAEL